MREAAADHVGLLPHTHEKVFRLDVPMDEAARVQELHSRHQLIPQHQHRLEGQLAAAKRKQVLEGGAKQVHNHHVVVSFLGEPMHLRRQWITNRHRTRVARGHTSGRSSGSKD